jgi:hypothetical protein
VAVQLKLAGDVWQIRGSLDQSADFSGIKITSPLKLDLSAVDQVNSLGIQKFVQFLQGCGSKEIEYQACSVAFLLAMSMVPALFTPSPVKVRSVFLPYRCSGCFKTTEQLVDMAQVKNLVPPPPPACPKCKKGQLELEDEPEQYFQFLGT